MEGLNWTGRLERLDDAGFQEDYSFARNPITGTQAAENFHGRLVKLANLHVGYPPVLVSVTDQHIIGMSHVDHRLGRDQERSPDIGAQTNIREHARAKLIVRIA